MGKTLIVADEFRLNELSLKPGGATLTVIYEDGKKYVYTKIKKPRAYIERVVEDNTVIEILVDGDSTWKRPK